MGNLTTVVDFERDGMFSGGGVQEDTIMRIGEKYYTTTLLPDGAVAEFQEVAPKLGVLDTQCPGVKLIVSSQGQGTRCSAFLLPNKTGKWELPVGHYYLWQFALSKTDDKNRECKLAGYYRRAQEFEITSETPVVLAMGLPLKLGYTITAGKQPGEVLINMNLTGKGGESYTPLLQTGPDEWAAEPATFTISDENGKELATGKFEYG